MRFPGRARAPRARRSAPSRPRSRLGDARAVAADDARAAVDAAAAAPLWRRVGAPAARALSPRLAASLPARGRGAAAPFRAGDGAAARVLVGALALRHALGDVADALTASEPAAELPFDAACVEAVARLQLLVDGVAAAGAADAARVAAVETALGALARFWPAARADAPERPPPRAAAWPAGARAPKVFAYGAAGPPARVAAGAAPRALAAATRPVAAGLPLAGELEAFAPRGARRGDAAAYAGVLGPPAELATRAGLPPLDQLAWWRFLLRHRGAVLLPFVDAERNAVTFINDARGPARSGPPPAGAAAANVEFAEVGGVVAVRALEDIAPGAALLIDYGDAYWHFAPKLADLRARLLDFVDVLAAARAWPRAGAARAPRPVAATRAPAQAPRGAAGPRPAAARARARRRAPRGVRRPRARADAARGRGRAAPAGPGRAEGRRESLAPRGTAAGVTDPSGIPGRRRTSEGGGGKARGGGGGRQPRSAGGRVNRAAHDR